MAGVHSWSQIDPFALHAHKVLTPRQLSPMCTGMKPSQGDPDSEWRSYVDDDSDTVYEVPDPFAPKPPEPNTK
jgi:hypothetical protein